MKKDHIQEGKIIEHSAGLGTPTPEMVEARAREIAVINGRAPDQLLESDWEQARAELTGEALASQEEAETNQPQWEVPGTLGSKARTVAAPDEQTDVEKFVDQGMEEAEHDSMLDHTKDALNEEKRSEAG